VLEARRRPGKIIAQRLGIAALAVAAVLAAGVPAVRAQFNRRGRFIGGPVLAGSNGINPLFQVAPGLTLQQWAFNNAVAARSMRGFVPFRGVNPFFNPFINPALNPLLNPSGNNSFNLSSNRSLNVSLNSSLNPFLNTSLKESLNRSLNVSANGSLNPFLFNRLLLNPAVGTFGNPYASLLSAPALPAYSPLGNAALTSAAALPGAAAYPGTAGYGGYPGYPTYYDPYSGYLKGGAEIIQAQGQLKILLEQANLVREQARSAEIDNRKKLFDEIAYERANTPSWTDRQEKARALSVRRSRDGTAPVTEIWSGKALNDILADLKRLRAKGQEGPEDIELDPDTLKQINVRGSGSGNIALLRNGGQLTWPVGLRELEPTDTSKEVRRLIESKAVEAVRQAENGAVSAGLIRDLQTNVNKLRRMLVKNLGELPTNQYIEAKRYLNNLDAAVQALQQPGVGNYFNQRWVAGGRTVRDLVGNMLKKGLTFAPAVAGDETAYQALHSALAAYDQTARQARDTKEK
jgi:hypothetical protein